MSLLHHIHRCNRWRQPDFRSLSIAGQTVGHVRPAVADALRDITPLFSADLDFAPNLAPVERSDAFRPIAAELAARGFIRKIRREDYRVVTDWGRPELMVMDRAIIPLLGIRAFGLHVNGWVSRPDGPHLWIGTRALDKAVEPGKLDNLVAGGQPAHLGLTENLVKEAAEEAGIDEALARSAQSVGAINYSMEDGHGVRRDTLFLYDLRLPENFTPAPVDGEMQFFTLMRWDAILDLLRQGDAFKFNVALVLIDFMIRHGIITPENEADYLALCGGLRAAL